jgi:hypothetical protein
MDSGGKNTKLGRLLTSAKEKGRRKREEGKNLKESRFLVLFSPKINTRNRVF